VRTEESASGVSDRIKDDINYRFVVVLSNWVSATQQRGDLPQRRTFGEWALGKLAENHLF
ncbi:unnamed protein product, partial [Ceratitis capitata]